jgi:phage antirepressor YoqD-like protein
MTSNIVPNFVRFDSEGLELVVNTTTGKAYASISATARMLETPRQTIQSAIKTCRTIELLSAQIETEKGLQAAELLTAFEVFKLAQKYHPLLADRMGEAGANIYMLALAGYKTEVVEQPDLPTDELGWMELAVAKKKEALALATQIETDRPNTELGKAIAKSENNIRIGDFAKVIGMGQNKYFDELRECKIIMATGRLPYQRFLTEGYFVVTEVVINNKVYPVSLITPKGQLYLVKRHQQHVKGRSVEQQVELALNTAIA